MNLIVQRYSFEHPSYTAKAISNNDILKGVCGTFNSVFGEMRDADTGKFICYTLERRDTLTADGEYNFTFHNSPSNKTICPHIWSDTCPKERYILIHIANYAYQLKGCTAVGVSINKTTPSLVSSRIAFNDLMSKLKNVNGTINYKTY